MILIFAAGTETRWKGKTLKQLALVKGKPVILRTIEQLEKRGVESIVITHKPAIQKIVPRYVVPRKRRWLPETFLSTEHLWKGRMAEFHGDVVWDDKALDKVLSSKGFHFFGTRHGKWENFCFFFDEKDYSLVRDSARIAIKEAGVKGRRCGSWELYRAAVGIPLEKERTFEDKVWQELKPGGEMSDYTQDFDKLKDYDLFMKRNPWARSV